MKIRKRTVFTTCERHGWLQRETRQRRAEVMSEGGPGQPCSGGTCRLQPGTDLFVPSVCSSDYPTPWTVTG